MTFTIAQPLQKEHEARDDVVAFGEALLEHAQTEDAVMYPAAILVGQVVRRRLGVLAAGRA